MKSRILSSPLFSSIALLAASVLMLCPTANAKEKDKGKHKGHGNNHGNGHRNDDSKRDRSHHSRDRNSNHSHAYRTYHSASRSTFYLSLGDGYAGRGYYYGPRNSPYYYERPEVRYYATREAAPREYYGGDSPDIAVQRALARAGYYNGPLDGDIGYGSQRAIARYQRDRGLRVSGQINQSLLNSLGL